MKSAGALICSILLFAADLHGVDYREEMRRFVMEISRYGKERSEGFIVIPQNGQELFTIDGTPAGEAAIPYLKAIDGTGREDLNYGYRGDNRKTPEEARDWMLPFLLLAEGEGVEVLVTDYCRSRGKMDESYGINESLGFISFSADRRDLDHIPSYPPEPYNSRAGDVGSLSDAGNFLYLINPGRFDTAGEMIAALEKTAYDVLIIDLFDNEGDPLSAGDVARLKVKPDGSKRLVIAYMSIGEAEDYRYYWKESWTGDPPPWMEGENPSWEGNYKVRYWDLRWKSLILGGKDSYLDRILDRAFDGVYLDLIDAFDYFESR